MPLGTESASTIPVFDIWTLWWAGGRLWHGYADFWNAPIFHPTAGTFAFSEPMLLPGLVAAPFFALGGPPALGHNVVLLATLAANGGFAARLARALGVDRAAALLAAVLVVTLPFFAKLQGELPILAVAGTLAALDGAVRFGRQGRTSAAVEIAAGLVAQALSCAQLALFALLFVGAAAVVAAGERRFSRATVGRLCAAIGAAALVIYALARAPLEIQRHLGFGRSAELVASLSATPFDFFTRPLHAAIPFPAREDAGSFTGGLFPGVLLLGLGAIGAGAVPVRLAGDLRRRWRWYLVGACVFAALLALGLNVSIAGLRPFALLRRLPGFDQIRSPFRAAVFLQIHLACLATLGLDALRRSLGEKSRGRTVVLVAGLVAAAENLSLPAPLLAVPPSPRTGWTAFLMDQPPDTVIAHVPFPSGPGVADFEGEAWRMFAQMDHGRPLVNGYASNFSAVYREFMLAMGQAFPKPILACALRTIFGAHLLIADRAWLAAHEQGMAELGPLLAPAYDDPEVAIFRITPPAGACPPMRIDIGGGG